MAATPIDPEDGPWIPTRGGNRRRIHTDESCPMLERSNASVRSASNVEVERFDECKHCAGSIDREGPQGPKPNKSLEEMDVDEFDAHLVEAGLR